MKLAYVFFCILFFATFGCKKSKPIKPIDYTPDKTILFSPANNEPCYTGAITSATQSTVTFQWSKTTNAETYELSIKNLETGDVTPLSPISTTRIDVSILQNTPYSWFVTAKSSRSTVSTSSDTWKFYNSAPTTKFHAPFPAEITAPLFGQSITAVSGKATLTWIGSDVDNDISNYDVYFGNSKTPPLIQDHITSSTVNNISVSSKTVYYWKVITRDSKDNTSDSGLYQFTVN